MARWLRSGMVSKNLIIILVVLVIAAGVFWIWKLQGESAEKAEAKKMVESLTADSYQLWCPECNKTFTLKAADARAVPKKDGQYQCPECKKFGAKFRPPSSAVKDVAP